MRWIRWAAIGAVCVLMLSGGTRERADREVVVFENHDCVQCRLFRRDVIEPYFRSNRGITLPMQVVDYDMLGTAGRALKRPIMTLPTSVILHNGREIGRVTGNPEPSMFMRLIDSVIADIFQS